MAIKIELIQPKTMKAEVNMDCVDDVFDAVVDAYLAGKVLARNLVEDICFGLYRDKNGGVLFELYESDEFLTALDWQYVWVTR